MNLRKYFLLVIIYMIYTTSLMAGHSEGNGGDHVRATFIKIGQAIISFLKETKEGQDLLQNDSLDLKDLEASLTIDVIKTSENILIDNGGARVDALGKTGSILLHTSSWAQHFEQERDVYYLVFHEMLRAISKNDDNYIISKHINPFPVARKVATRITPLIPLIPEDSLKKVIEGEKIAVAGSGCPLKELGTVAEFDSERNILDIFLRRFEMNLESTKKYFLRKNCSLAIPIKGIKGKRVSISLLDLLGKVDSTNGKGLVRFESFLAGEQGEVIKREYEKTKGGILLRKSNVLKSSCGEDAILRVNISGTISAQEEASEGMSLELDRISAYLALENC